MNCEQLKIAFAGTPEFAAVALDALIQSRHDVVAVLTQPDRPAGRGRKLTASAVKERALAADIPVLQPVTLRDPEAFNTVAALDVDVWVVAAYGLILPANVLDLPSLGCLNIHGSLLPRWRGAAPIHRAVLAGDEQTGVCIMRMDEGLDTGDMLLSKSIDIGENDTVSQLHDRLAMLGAEALLEALPLHCAGKLPAVAQPEEGVSYAEKLSKAEAKLDFRDSSEMLHRKIRAFNPWPVAEGTLCEQRVRIWQSRLVSEKISAEQVDVPSGTVIEIRSDAIRVKTGDGCLDLINLQWPGKKAQDAGAFARSRSLFGEQFS